jgi:hypothetical protein
MTVSFAQLRSASAESLPTLVNNGHSRGATGTVECDVEFGCVATVAVYMRQITKSVGGSHARTSPHSCSTPSEVRSKILPPARASKAIVSSGSAEIEWSRGHHCVVL